MGRFYKTDKPTFFDFVYQPNLDLQMAVANQQVKSNYLKSKLLQETPDVQLQHLNFDSENERVKEIQNKYNTSIGDLTQKMYENPEESQKYLSELKTLQRDMLQDRTAGEWYNIEQRHSNYKQWYDENKKRLDDGEISSTLFNRLNNHWYSDVENRATQDGTAKFKGQQIIDRPQLTDKQMTLLSKLKADSYDHISGGYKINDEVVTEAELENMAWGMLSSDEDFQGYNNQMYMLGDDGYMYKDKNGKLHNQSPFEFIYTDKEGKQKPITGKEYNELTSEERKRVSRQLNQQSAYYSDLATVDGFAHKSRTFEADKFALEKMKQSGRLNLAKLNNQAKRNLAKYKQKLKDDAETKLQLLKEMPSLILSTTTEGIVTPEEFSKNGEFYTNILEGYSKANTTKKISKEDYLNSIPEQDKMHFQKIENHYDQLVKNNSKELYEASVESGLIQPTNDFQNTPEYWNSQEGKLLFNTLKDVIGQTYKLKNHSWGQGHIQMINEYESEFIPDDAYRQRKVLEKIQSNMKGKIKDLDTKFASELRIARSYLPIDNNTQLGKIGISIMDALVMNNTPVTYDKGKTARDLDGKLRKQEDKQYAVDDSLFSTGETTNVIKSLMEKLNLKSINDLKEYGDVNYGFEGSSVILNFKPDNNALKDAGVDSKGWFGSDSGWTDDGFTFRYDNNNIKPALQAVKQYIDKAGDLATPELIDAYMHHDSNYAINKQMVQVKSKELTDGITESTPFNLPGKKENEYRIIKQDNGFLNIQKKQNGNWNYFPETIDTKTGKLKGFSSQEALYKFLYLN